MNNIIKRAIKGVYYSIPYSWRVPQSYKNTYALITSGASIQSVKDWQLLKLKEIVNHAYQNTAGYNQLFSEAGIKPEDIRNLNDIKYLPFIEKEIIRDNIKDFTARNIRKWELRLAKTSGSSGIPFGFYRTISEDWIEQAFVAKAWSYGGWDLSQSGIMLRGGYAGDAEHIIKKCDNGSFYIHNNSYMMSPNFLTDQYYHVYQKFLTQHTNLSFFFALPSSITLLSRLIIENKDEGLSSIKSIYLGSETVYPWQYEIIRKAFPEATIISVYGQTERVIMGYWRSDNQKYYIDPYYGITELISAEKEVGLKQRGELIGTSFWNKATPFIRYRTRDYAILGSEPSEKTGLEYLTLDTIEGRLQDVLVSKNDRLISIASFDGSLEHGSLFDDVVQFKIIQYEKGILKIEIQVRKGFSNQAKLRFENAIAKYLGDDFSFVVEIVDSILPGKNGKYKSIEQHLPVNFNFCNL